MMTSTPPPPAHTNSTWEFFLDDFDGQGPPCYLVGVFPDKRDRRAWDVVCELEGLAATEANGRLIAATPELLEHLRNIAAEAENSRDTDDPEPERTFAKIADIARLAIAKAEGRA